MTAVIAVSSGKAAVGKSILSANLARYLNRNGHRTGLLIAGGRRPVWGIEPSTSWPDILTGRLPLDKAIHRDVFGTDLMVVRGQGHALRDLAAQPDNHLDDPLGILDAFTYLIVDICPGNPVPAMACCLAATETILVLTPDTETISATYEWLGQLSRNGFSGQANLVLNKVRKPALAQSIYIRFRDLTQKRLRIQTNLWGSMSREDDLDAAAASQQPLSQIMSQSRLLRDIQAIGDRLLAEQPPENQTRPLKDFWREFIHRQQQLPEPPPSSADRTKVESEPEPLVLTPSPDEGNPPPRNDNPPTGGKTEEASHLGTILTTIARELNSIRRLLESRPHGNPLEPVRSESAPPDATSLDFDAFIKQHPPREER